MQWNRSIRSRYRGLTLALLVGAAAGGCSHPTSVAVQPDYAVARSRWRDTAPPAYEVTIRISCFCPASNGARLLVRDGAIVSSRDPVTGMPLATVEAERYPTVDGLFAYIAEASGNPESRVEAAYDVTYGFPRQAWIDHRVTWADDEVGYTLSDFRPR